MNKALRYLALPVIAAALHGTYYALPKAGAPAESAVRMQLPATLGDWKLNVIPASEKEIKTLAGDTEFAKAVCIAPRPGEYTPDGRPIADRIDLSIVLSGHDLTNSIHRPERCMPAQGHDITASSTVNLKLADGHQFKARKLLSRQSIPLDKEQKQILQLKAVTYYFFVGSKQITHDHTLRTLFDMRDRLVHGVDQRWAYVSVTTWYGKMPGLEQEISEQDAETKIRQFLAKLAETSVDWQMIGQ